METKILIRIKIIVTHVTGGKRMPSLLRRLALGTFAGIALAVVLFLAGSAVLAAVPTLPAALPAGCAAVGLVCGIGTSIADDLKAETDEEEKPKT